MIAKSLLRLAPAVVVAFGLSVANAQQQPAPGAAPQAAPAQEFAKDHLASAKAAMDALQLYNSLDTLLLEVALQVKNTLTKNNPTLGPQIDEVTNKIAIDLAARRPDLDKKLQIVWASRFTKAELDDITKFLNSPTGKKWTKELPGLMNGATQTIVTWQRQIGDEMLAKVRAELIKRGIKL